MLGLDLLVIGVVVLLGGTLRAVWSSFHLRSAFRAELNESTAAEKLSGLVGKFASPSTLAMLIRDPDRLRQGTREIETAIRESEEAARESIAGEGESVACWGE